MNAPLQTAAVASNDDLALIAFAREMVAIARTEAGRRLFEEFLNTELLALRASGRPAWPRAETGDYG